MERRGLLKTVGSIGAVTTVGGFGLALSGAAAAQSGLSIDGSSVSNDDGDVSKVDVALYHQASWDGFDVPVHAVEYQDVLKLINENGNEVESHVLRNGLNTPVLLEEFSGNDDSDGWGGNDEYFDSGTEDEDDGFEEAGYLSGKVHAGIDWTVVADDTADDVNTPPEGEVADWDLDNDDDDSSTERHLRFVKTVQFYTRDKNGDYTTAISNKSVALMGGDDGTVSETVAEGDFLVTVGNEEATHDSTGSGTSDAS